jgi:signal transduction histidine kinase/CHASE1-domain containing sensor protein/ActR/RegA family two-component response regulator
MRQPTGRGCVMAVVDGTEAPPQAAPPPPETGAGGRAGPALLALLALAVASGLTFQAWRSAWLAEEAEQRTEFDARVADARSRILQRMHAYQEVLRGVEGLYAASTSVERAEFRAYVTPLRLAEAYPGIQGVGFGLLVPAARRRALEAAIRHEGFPGFAVRPDGGGGALAPVVFVEPFEGRNLRAFGYDMLSEPLRREAMERARDSGQPALTSRLTLVVETGEDVQAGALLYLPIYRNGAPLGSVAERREALLGWVYSSFRMGDLMRGILGQHAVELDVEIFDGVGTAPEELMFHAVPSHAAGQGREGGHHAERTLEIAGRTWTMVLAAPAEELAPLARRSTLLAAAGVGGGAVLAMLLWLLGAGRARALEAARRWERELSERRRAAAEVEAAHQVAQATLDAMPEQICVLDEAGVIIAVNRAWREFGEANGAAPGGLGHGTRYLAACDRAAAAGDASAARFAVALRTMLLGRQATFTHEYECHAPGAPRWFTALCSRFSDGDRARAVVVHQDVTDRVLALAALREGEARLRLANAASGQVEWDLEVATGHATIGPGWHRLTGHGAEPPGDLGAYLAHVHPEDRASLGAAFEACLEGRTERVEQEHRLLQAGGAARWLRLRGQVTSLDAGGRPLRLTGTITDIDEVHALQERLLAATRLASVGTLAAGVAHEINNPLSWLHANLSLGLEVLDGEAAARPERLAELRLLLGEALEGTGRIAAVVKAMRSLGRPEEAEEARPVDVRAELLHAVQMVRNQVQQRAALVLEIPEGLPPVRARTSELGRVFLNLLLNASQAVGDARPRPHQIDLRARAEGGEVVVEVSDDGPGIPAAVRERIFEPFFTTKPVGQGTGLGLPIARSIVAAAGGTIEVESTEGRGATFRVRLPAAPTATPASGAGATHAAAGARERGAAADGPRSGGAATNGAAAPAGPRHRILLVDDEPSVARSLARWLERHHEVTTLPSAREALGRLDAGERWDAMLFDLMMPGLDGPAVHQALSERHPALLGRLAFITGGAFGERATSFLATHPVPVLTKPVELPRLLELVERLAAAAISDARSGPSPAPR